MEIDVRIGETDMLGHINNNSFFIYLEDSRIKFLQNIGMSFNDSQFTFVLVSTKCDFINQGYFGNKLQINTKLSKIGNTSITLSEEIIEKETRNLLVKGESTVIYFDIINQEKAVIPDSLREQLNF